MDMGEKGHSVSLVSFDYSSGKSGYTDAALKPFFRNGEGDAHKKPFKVNQLCIVVILYM